ncbi:MAG TPA: DUF4412 domain-containing protein [Gemmatimonadales bacterium]
MKTLAVSRRAAILASAFALIAAAPAPARIDGYVVTQRITSGSEPAVTLKIKVAQGKVRVEMSGGPQGGMPEGMFMLLNPDGKVTAVMPTQGMAMMMDAGQLSGGMGDVMRMMGMAEPSVSDVSVNVTDLGAGEAILGYPTRKYRVSQQYTMTTSMRGQSRTEKHDDVSELWMTTSMPGFTEGLEKFAESFGNAFGGAGQGASKELAAAMAGKIPRGYPLKTIVTSNTTVGDGPARPTTTTLEVLDVTKTSIDAAEFEVPAGIQVIDPAAMMRGRGRGQ